MIDLRSDTVTRPSQEMLKAMCAAPTGDDVYAEDPTVNMFQEEMAALFGKEAGLFVPTGCMSNQLAIKAWTTAGDEVIVEKESHIFNYETAAPSMWSAVQLHTIPGIKGVMKAEDVAAAVRPGEYYYPRTALVCAENTHNRAGGTVYPLRDLQELHSFCTGTEIPLHLDGARIWNAHVASGVSFADWGRAVDSISICFSKGLGAPVGSMLLGPGEFITRAHKYRKIFGGGMRQAGVLAAAARFGVEHNLPRLELDHQHAGRFANALAGISAFRIDVASVETNMVMLDFAGSVQSADAAMAALREHGVLIGHGAGETLRAVFHIDLSSEDTDRSIEIITTLFG